eukprot:4854700-Alexandrium_andersonii.AAC.1
MSISTIEASVPSGRRTWHLPGPLHHAAKQPPPRSAPAGRSTTCLLLQLQLPPRCVCVCE